MKDNTQEKNLIEKNENNIFGKIKNFFKKIFGIKEENIERAVKLQIKTAEDFKKVFSKYLV